MYQQRQISLLQKEWVNKIKFIFLIIQNYISFLYRYIWRKLCFFCPDCKKKKPAFYTVLYSSNHSKSYQKREFCYKEEFEYYGNILFGTAMKNECRKSFCSKEYYVCFYIDADVHAPADVKYLILREEEFKEATEDYYINTNLLKYLPTEDLERTYNDAKSIITRNTESKELQIGVLRPLIEAFLIERNNLPADDIRKSIKNLDDSELEKALHKIIDDTLKGVHIKNIPLNNNPQDVLNLLETLFTKIYKLPIEEEKLKREFEDKKRTYRRSISKKIKVD